MIETNRFFQQKEVGSWPPFSLLLDIFDSLFKKKTLDPVESIFFITYGTPAPHRKFGEVYIIMIDLNYPIINVKVELSHRGYPWYTQIVHIYINPVYHMAVIAISLLSTVRLASLKGFTLNI